MTREELLRALVVERYAPLTPPPPSRRGPDLDGWADHDPDADAEPDDAGEWYGDRRVEAIQPRGEFL